MLGANVMNNGGETVQNGQRFSQESGKPKQGLAEQCLQLPPALMQSQNNGTTMLSAPPCLNTVTSGNFGRGLPSIMPPKGQHVQEDLLGMEHLNGLAMQEVLQQPGLQDRQTVHCLNRDLELSQGNVLECKPSEGETVCPPTDNGHTLTLPTQDTEHRWARSSLKNSMVDASQGALLCSCKLKKRVQFADSIGLTLASVKHFLSSEEPTVPPAVLARLQSYPPTTAQKVELNPGETLFNVRASLELLQQLETQRLCLEHVSSSNWGIKGTLLIQDPPDGVQVKIRYTFNNWLSYLDCPASAIEFNASECSCPTAGVQRFLFTLCPPPSTVRIQFAICCNLGHGQELWDNNQGNNYTVDCLQEKPLDFQASNLEPDSWGGTQHW
uniref:CBM21 domain-containing protein n=1 Tax=Leptobrachium leishanense TaxID=445787 RepID=A0A8C5M706_9ANUR